MDNNNHSHSRRRKHTINGGAAFLYDDVYGGPATSSNSLSPRLEDYSEIFGAFSASRASSIPTLHLPVAADEDGDEFFDVRSSGFDYSEVFGGFEALDFAVAYEDLIKPPPKNDGADSSDEAWTPEGSGSVSGESNHSLKNQSFSDDHYYSYNGSSEFGISHDKAHKKSGKESLKGRAYVNPVTAASEYSFMADEVTAVRETEFDNSRWKVTEDRKFNVDMLNEEHLRKNVSPASNGSSTKQTYGDSWKPERVSGRNGSRNKVPFVTISDINLRTQPSHLPPPYRPPPIVNCSSGDSSRLSSNSNTVSSDGRTGDISPPFFDVEVDASSSAAVSAAAMIEAMEKASIQLRTAKELMQRKKEGSHSRSKSRSKKDNKEVGKVGKYDDGSGSKSDNKARATSEIDDSKMKFSVSEKPKVMKKVREEPETLRDEKSSEATRSVVHEKHAKGSWASQVSFKIDEASEWQEATQYFELVALDDTKQALELGNKDKISGETAKADDPEVLEQKRSELEACNARSKDAKSQVRKEHEKMVKVSQETFEKGENEMDSGMGKLPAELEKHRGRSVKSERYENMAEVQGKENKFGIENALQQNHTELKFKENDRAIRFEERCKEFHGTEGIENRQKSSEQDENERRLVGAFKQAESEKRLMELLEKEKRLKETQEQVENEKRLKKALELQESEKKLKEALEQEKRRTEAAQREENEKRLKEALEKEENEKRLKEENEKRLRKALEMQESEKKMKEALDQENQRRQKEAAQREESEKRLKETLEFEEYQKRQNDSHEVEDHRFSDDTCNQVCNENPKGTQIARNNDENSETMKEYQEAHAHKENGKKKSNSNHSDTLTGPEVVKMTNGPVDEQSSCLSGSSQAGTESGNSYFSLDDAYQSIPFVNFVKKAVEAGSGPENPEPRSDSMSQKDSGHETHKMECAHERENRERDAKQVHASSNREEHMPAPVKEFVDSRRRTEAAKPAVTEINNRKSSQHVNASQAPGGMVKNLKEDPLNGDRERERLKRETELENDCLRKIEEEREREREKDRMAVDRETLEARDWAYVEARERAERVALERATADARQKAMAEARERLEKACADAREKSLAGKAAMEARLRAERAAVERATAEARERAAEKLMAERERVERTVSDKFSTSSRNNDMRHCSSSSDLQDPHTSRHPYSTANGERYGDEGESPQRCKARLERHARTAERAAKALAEKNMRDLLAQREQAEKNRLAETLDADVKRWSSGKEGNLRALLSTLQYILGSDSGWQPIPLTEVITTAAVKKAYRKATLCVHPDKLQQRGASIHQKYICEKVFDLLKEAWNKFNSEER